MASVAQAAAPRLRETRHKGPVRITHWINVVTFAALTISGIGILLAHPRFYWGEVGYFDMPAAFELPLAVNKHHTSWGRGVHFFAAWLAVANGLAYVIWGLTSRHFWSNFLPQRPQLQWSSIAALLSRHLRFRNPSEPSGYNLFQKLSYAGVVFGLLPLAILTGLTMSPGFTAAFPQLFTLFGGRQSARTIHFFAANALVLFVAVHILMVALSGFRSSLRAMITGRPPAGSTEHP